MDYFNFIKWVEKVLIAGVILGLVLLIACQALLTIDPVRFYLNVAEKLEGKMVNFYEEFPETRVASGQYQSVFATVTIQIENFSSLEKAVLLINGKKVTDFRQKQVTVKVSPGDVLAIDGSFYIHELIFKVAAVSENVAQPEIGQVIRVKGDVVTIGEVKLE